jgi:hypothetical protein
MQIVNEQKDPLVNAKSHLYILTLAIVPLTFFIDLPDKSIYSTCDASIQLGKLISSLAQVVSHYLNHPETNIDACCRRK